MTNSIILVNPNYSGSSRHAKFLYEGLMLGVLSSFLEREGFNVVICDSFFYKQTPSDAFNELKRYSKPLIVGITLMTKEPLPWVLEYISLIRNEYKLDVHITLGGYYPTLQCEKIWLSIPDIDSVVIGEGELTLLELATSLKNGKDWHAIEGIAYCSFDNKIIVNPRRKLLTDLDQLPWPKRYLALEMNEDFEVLIDGSRGCIQNCSFCAIKPFFKSTQTTAWRTRSPENIINEIISIRRKNPKLYKFRFVDPDFIGPSGIGEERAFSLALLMQQKLPGIDFFIEGRAVSIKNNRMLLQELKKAGLKSIHIGIESANQHVLDKMAKKTQVQDNRDAVQLLRELKIDFAYGFIMFTPWTTELDILENIQFMEEIGNVQLYKLFNTLYLVPGTPSIKLAQKLGPIFEKGKSGNYKFSSNTPIINLLIDVWDVIKNKVSFNQSVWYLYKDTQVAIQRNTNDALRLKKLTDDLFLSMFRFCLQKAQESVDDYQMNADLIANECVEKFKPQADAIIAQLDPKIRFRRADEIRRAIIK